MEGQAKMAGEVRWSFINFGLEWQTIIADSALPSTGCYTWSLKVTLGSDPDPSLTGLCIGISQLRA